MRRRIGQLSKGYKQRVGLAAALVHNPPVLILDEPTSGLDPSQIRETRSLIKTLATDRTVLVSSHILPEVEQTCDRVIIITRGRVRAAERYRARLGDILVPWEPGAVHHLLVARVPAERRERIRDDLGALGIATGVHYPVPLSRQPALAPWARPTPNAEDAADRVLSLPMDPLMTLDEVDYVSDRLAELL